jgi:hypothetical protein
MTIKTTDSILKTHLSCSYTSVSRKSEDIYFRTKGVFLNIFDLATGRGYTCIACLRVLLITH